MKNLILLSSLLLILGVSCKDKATVKSEKKKSEQHFPETITIDNIAQNPEGIEYDKRDKTFLLSSLNAGPIIKVNLDGTYKPFTSGEPFPLSSAGLQVDYDRNRLLATGFNGMELMDDNPDTKGISNLRIYNLNTGVLEKDINLSSLLPDAGAYFANDIAVDDKGNVYVSDWYAGSVYKVDLQGNPSLFWSNETGVPSGPNGLDFHPDGYLLVSILNVNEKGLYSDFGLVKIPVDNPKEAKLVDISASEFTGFDGMVITAKGNVVGVTNNGTSPGGNMLIELTGKNDWKSAEVLNAKPIQASTTVAITPEKMNYIINQDFSSNTKESWTIERINF
jgi:sugar lactone lactonase YvrE